MPLPRESPSRIDVKKFISVKAEPTAARASAPRKRPTDQRIGHVVTLLQEVPQNIGTAKSNIVRITGPRVKSLTMPALLSFRNFEMTFRNVL